MIKPFFHASIKTRSAATGVCSLFDSSGSKLVDQQDIANEFVGFYKSFLGVTRDDMRQKKVLWLIAQFYIRQTNNNNPWSVLPEWVLGMVDVCSHILGEAFSNLSLKKKLTSKHTGIPINNTQHRNRNYPYDHVSDKEC
jgi:hypothetical protein